MLITADRIAAYAAALAAEERATGTIEKYRRDLTALAQFLDGGALTQESAAAWKKQLLGRGYAPCTVNAMLAALNGFCRFHALSVRVRYLRLQRRLFRDSGRELTQADYERLLSAADGRAALLLETLCATGVRVSELRFITVEAARSGRTDIHLKGKIRTILLPRRLCRRLLSYAAAKKIASGELFLAEGDRGLSRFQIYRMLKALGRSAGVEETRVFPHNCRHFFAAAFYRAYRDIAQLADLLGHSSIETTRVYLAASGAEHRRRLERLGLLP